MFPLAKMPKPLRKPPTQDSGCALFLLSLLVALHPEEAAAAAGRNEERMAACKPKSCDKGPTVTYPFWIDGHHPSYCGIRLYKLSCDEAGSGYPLLSISGDEYIVANISYDHASFDLKRKALSANRTICDQFPTRNFTLDKAPYDVSKASNASLVFFSHCNVTRLLPLQPQPQMTLPRTKTPAHPPLATVPPPWLPLPCDPLEQGLASYVGYSLSVSPPLPHQDTFQTACSPPVILRIAPFPPHSLGANATTYKPLLDFRITLNWTSPSCTECQSSGGLCGTDHHDTYFDLICICSDGDHRLSCDSNGESRNLSTLIIIGIIIGALLIGGICFLFFLKGKCHTMFRLCHRIWDDSKTIEVFLEEYTLLALQRFTYIELRNITKSFKEKLGQGGYGRVFKGKLKDGRLVAVKLLNDSGTNGQEFMNEVASIGRTNHVNIVNLLGFCSEGTKRALVYEFMPNGSLEKFLSLNNLGIAQSLQWEDLYKIAVGIARGLEYLHKGCTTRVVHFDIKPHNILLDDNLNRKISDFGLAKLCPSKESILSMNIPRGTVGYIAPEVFSRNFGVVSSKSDVYSYGMLLLEIVGLRKKKNVGIQDTETSIYFPHWIYEQFDQNGDLNFYDITTNDLDHELVKKLILIGLWCIQTYPAKRPSISKVIEMLDGKYEDLEMPPKPYICSPTRSSMEFDSTTMC